jgi:hypothetical protein
MKCQRCGSERILFAQGKCSDLCFARIGNSSKEHDGYVPKGLGIGGGDEIEVDVCLDCGQLQGQWPVPKHELEE